MQESAAYPPSRPSGRPVLHMRWLSLLFLHWPVPVEMLRPLIPEALEIDTFDGQAWIGLVPFTMRDVRPWWQPNFISIPTLTHFHECNVRTYVTFRKQPGVWFFSLDAACRLGVWTARTFWNLPYFYSQIHLQQDDNVIDYNVNRADSRSSISSATMNCKWKVGEKLPQSKPGELAYFLTERYSLYSTNRREHLFRGRIWHKPWPLHNAELLHLDDTLVRSASIDIDPNQPPLVHYAEDLNVDAWALQPMR